LIIRQRRIALAAEITIEVEELRGARTFAWSSPMSAAEELCKRAEHCFRQANTPGLSPSVKLKLLQLAAQWQPMADNADSVAAIIEASSGNQRDRDT
jgi:hypothetical protein